MLIDMKIRTQGLVLTFNVVSVFLISYFVGSYFILGDQALYRSIYMGLSEKKIIEGYQWYISQIDSKEIGHFFLVWLASPYIEKDLFNSISNAILAFYSTKLYIRWGARPWVTTLLVVFGYYHLSMYLSAERLKYAFIFVVFSIYFFKYKGYILLNVLLAIITHVQSIIIFGSIYFSYVVGVIRRGAINVFSIIVLIVLLAVVLFLSEHILSKITYYYNNFHGFGELIKIFLFFFLALFYSRKKMQTFLLFIPLFVAVYIVGGMRVNLIGYFIFLYYGLKVNGGENIGVLSTSIYFLFGWFEYVFNVLEYGVNTPLE